ncbi:hypothetical protein BDQ17DRAFT_997401 [Cyathus striatus]|nr:hypothetical protein BDQ17DRAFT_997401 [Cyathus striatus]
MMTILTERENPSWSTSYLPPIPPLPLPPARPSSPHLRTQPSKPKLAQGIEQFLLSFSYPLATLAPRSASAPSSRSSSFSTSPTTLPCQDDDNEKPAPFILAPKTIGHMLPNGGRGISVGEVILLGLIDPKDHAFGSGRAWIGSGEGVIVTGGLGEMPEVVFSSPSSPRGFDSPASGKGKGKMRMKHPLPTPPSSQESMQEDDDRGVYMPRSNSSSSSSSGGEITVPPAAVIRSTSINQRSVSLPTPVPASLTPSHAHSHSQQYDTNKSRRASFFGLGSRSPSALGHFDEKKKAGKMEKVGSKLGLGLGRFWKGENVKVAA